MMMMMKVILQIVLRGDAVVQITTGAPLLERPFKTDTVLSISKELSDDDDDDDDESDTTNWAPWGRCGANHKSQVHHC